MTINYNLVIVVMLFIVLMSIQFTLNKIYVLDFTGNFEYFAEFGNDLLIIESYEKESKSIVVDLINKKVLILDRLKKL